MKEELYKQLKQKVDNLEKLVNGGKGSGNFGHSGRPGQVGGSGEGGGVGDAYAKLTEKAKTEGKEMVDKMTKEEIAEKFWDKKTSAEDKAKLIYGVDKLYRKEGAARDHDAGDDLAYSKKQFLKDEIVRRGSKKNSVLEEVFRKLDGIEKKLNGGKGSGNFGHAGRPGEVGGSAPSGSGSSQSDSSDFLARHESKRAEYSLSANKGYNALKEGETDFKNVEELANGALTLFSRLEESETLDVAAADALNTQMDGLTPKLKKAMESAGLTSELRGVMKSVGDAREELYYLTSEIARHSQSTVNYARGFLTPLDTMYENINTHIKKAESKISKANRENKEVDEYYTEARYMLEGLGNAAKKIHNLVNELPNRVPHDIIINKPKENK